MTLLVVFGPPAVGKMTVGRAIADLRFDNSDLTAEEVAAQVLGWLASP